MPGMLGYSVPDDTIEKFHDTWLYQKNVQKYVGQIKNPLCPTYFYTCFFENQVYK